MRVAPDTNLLVRIVVGDDHAQSEVAARMLDDAEAVALSLPCLCEFVWVLRSVYRLPTGKIAASVRAMTERRNALIEIAAVKAGLRVLDEGGDFADGAIAAAGMAMGADTFVSFDRKAVTRVKAVGLSAKLVSASS